MSTSGKKLVVRHGTLEDSAALFEIDVYLGMDYLSAKYESYCNDPNRINYILEADGKLVAYFVASIVDDGEGVIFAAARTHQDHRGLGYQNYLKKAAAAELKTMYPNMKEVLNTAGSSKPDDTALYKIVGSRRILLAMPFYYYHLTTPELMESASKALITQQQLGNQVEKLEFSRITEYLERDDFRSLFPADRALIGWTPYKLSCKANFSLNHRFPDYFGLSYDENGKIEGVSFRTLYLDKTRNYERHNLEVYSNSIESALKHTAFHLDTVLKVAQCKNVYFCPLYTNNIGNPDDFDDILKRMFSLSGRWPEDYVKYIPLVCDTQYFS